MTRSVQLVLSGLFSALFCAVYVWRYVGLPLRQEQAVAIFGELVFAFIAYIVCMSALGFFRAEKL